MCNCALRVVPCFFRYQYVRFIQSPAPVYRLSDVLLLFVSVDKNRINYLFRLRRPFCPFTWLRVTAQFVRKNRVPQCTDTIKRESVY
jgi:hypothetical protein